MEKGETTTGEPILVLMHDDPAISEIARAISDILVHARETVSLSHVMAIRDFRIALGDLPEHPKLPGVA